MSQALRSSTLSEVRALSMASLYNRLKNPTDGLRFLQALRDGRGDALAVFSKFFVPIGLAQSVRLDEDWGTQSIYGIGDPTRPTMVPGNYSVSASIEKLQLDGRDGFSFITSPDYWYSKFTQRLAGNNDWGLYTYLYLHNRDNKDHTNVEIYALMPKSASKAVSSNDVMIVHNVQMVGFKYQYLDFVGDLMGNSGILGLGRTASGSVDQDFGVVRGSTAASSTSNR